MRINHYLMKLRTFRTLVFIFCLAIVTIAAAKTNYKPISVNQDSVNGNHTIFIGDYNVTLMNDSTFDSIYLKINNARSQFIDTTCFSPYESRFFALDSKLSKDTIVIWSIDNEYYSVLHLFYVKNNKILKMGELSPLLICKSCDTQSYPLSRIKFVDEKSSIKIRFLDPAMFKDEKTDNVTTNKVFFEYNKQESKLRMRYR